MVRRRSILEVLLCIRSGPEYEGPYITHRDINGGYPHVETTLLSGPRKITKQRTRSPRSHDEDRRQEQPASHWVPKEVDPGYCEYLRSKNVMQSKNVRQSENVLQGHEQQPFGAHSRPVDAPLPGTDPEYKPSLRGGSGQRSTLFEPLMSGALGTTPTMQQPAEHTHYAPQQPQQPTERTYYAAWNPRQPAGRARYAFQQPQQPVERTYYAYRAPQQGPTDMPRPFTSPSVNPARRGQRSYSGTAPPVEPVSLRADLPSRSRARPDHPYQLRGHGPLDSHPLPQYAGIYQPPAQHAPPAEMDGRPLNARPAEHAPRAEMDGRPLNARPAQPIPRIELGGMPLDPRLAQTTPPVELDGTPLNAHLVSRVYRIPNAHAVSRVDSPTARPMVQADSMPNARPVSRVDSPPNARPMVQVDSMPNARPVSRVVSIPNTRPVSPVDSDRSAAPETSSPPSNDSDSNVYRRLSSASTHDSQIRCDAAARVEGRPPVQGDSTFGQPECSRYRISPETIEIPVRDMTRNGDGEVVMWSFFRGESIEDIRRQLRPYLQEGNGAVGFAG